MGCECTKSSHHIDEHNIDPSGVNGIKGCTYSRISLSDEEIKEFATHNICNILYQ